MIFKISRSSALSVLALSLGAIFFILVLFLIFSFGIQSLTPADFLPAEGTHLLLSQGKTQEKEDFAFRSLFPDLVLPPFPPEFAPYVTGERVDALLTDNGVERWITFSRLRPGRRVYQEAKTLVENSSSTSLQGMYLVSGLLPSSALSLAKDPAYRSTLESLPAASFSFLYLKRKADTVLPFPLPPFLRGVTDTAEHIGMTLEEREGEQRLSVSVPGHSSIPSPRRSLSFLPDILSETSFPLLIALEGTDLQKEFDTLTTMLAENNDDRAFILRGIVSAKVAEMFGGGERTLEGPYTFLLRQGSGSSLEWLLALENDDREELLSNLEKGFSARFPPAIIREHILPDGVTFRDVRADSGSIKANEEHYRGFTIRTLRHSSLSQEFSHAFRDSLLLLSNSELFLRETLSLSFSSKPSFTHIVYAAEEAFERLGPLFATNSPFFSSLQNFRAEKGSLTWMRSPQVPQVRHFFLRKP